MYTNRLLPKTVAKGCRPFTMNLVKAKWQSFTLSSGILPLAARVKGLWACLGPKVLGGVGWFIVAAAFKKKYIIKRCKMWPMFTFDHEPMFT